MDSLARFDYEVTYSTPLMNAGKALRIESRHALELDDVETASKAAESLMRVGAKLRDARGSMIHHLIGVFFFRSGLECVEEIVNAPDAQFSLDQYERLEKALTDISGVPSNLNFTLQTEYLSFKRLIDELKSGKLQKKYNRGQYRSVSTFAPFLQRNDTIRLYYDLTKPVFESLREDADWQVKQQRFEDLHDSIIELKSNLPRLFISPNAVGKMVILMATPVISSVASRDVENEALVAATQILLAIKRFELENGSPPASLEDLEPHFLSMIPEDPFSGSAMQWDPATGTIYSIGRDGTDDGGKVDEKSRRSPSDIGVKFRMD